MFEKRKYPRIKTDFRALCKNGGNSKEKIRVHNISRGGLFLVCEPDVCQGDIIQVVLDQIEGERQLFINCRVVRKLHELGIALSILSTSDDNLFRKWLTTATHRPHSSKEFIRSGEIIMHSPGQKDAFNHFLKNSHK
ncbi:MAG: PilZ domain-containing protein [Deltaproteobacteria bacterium]|nr:PilZ domain-containing protein [Deltaproteobacteria bacterium]